jgi:succinate dehydrogenase subunit C
MSETYTEFHPRWYRKRVSTYWWIGQRHYTKFILRELSSVAVALFVIFTLLLIRALKAGPEAYARYMHRLASPLMIAFSFVAFCFVLLHTITWFNLTPRAMAVRVRGKRVPEFLVVAPNYALWTVASIAIAWIVLRKP